MKQADHPNNGIKWPRLFYGSLIKRYKRFLADVRLDNGSMVTAHCPNSGSMKACALPLQPVYLSYHDSPHRKCKYTWEMIQMPTSLVGVNTQIPNKLVRHAIENGQIPELQGYDTIIPEKKINARSRLDLLLTQPNRRACFVEIKNSTLVEYGKAAFPDAVTQRGRKHLVDLQQLVHGGHRAVIFFLIQRMDAKVFHPADHIDPAYGQELRLAVKNGVELLVYDTFLDLKGIALRREIPYLLDP